MQLASKRVLDPLFYSVGLVEVEANELAMIERACCRWDGWDIHYIMRQWLVCVVDSREGKSGKKRVDKAERVQTLLQSEFLGSSSREQTTRVVMSSDEEAEKKVAPGYPRR
jgi:hypothetical protein